LGTHPLPSNFGAGADFGPPSDTLTCKFLAWAEAAQLETLDGVGEKRKRVTLSEHRLLRSGVNRTHTVATATS
jgi:hypothetical protein